MAADKAHPGSALVPASGATRTSGGFRSDGRPRQGLITGYLLKLIRESAGLTQETLAEHLAVDANTVQGWGRAGGARLPEPAWQRWCSYDIGSASSAPTRGWFPHWTTPPKRIMCSPMRSGSCGRTPRRSRVQNAGVAPSHL
jgi:hypothetical protein